MTRSGSGLSRGNGGRSLLSADRRRLGRGEEVAAGQLARGQDEIEIGSGLLCGGTILGSDAAGGVGDDGGALDERLEPPALQGHLVGGLGDDLADVRKSEMNQFAASSGSYVTQARSCPTANGIGGDRGEQERGRGAFGVQKDASMA